MMRVRTFVSGAAIAVAVGVFAVAGYAWLQPSYPAAAPAALTIATAEVTRGTLRDTKTVTGTLSYGEVSSLRPALAGGSAMVTWIAPVGSTIGRGEPLYRLDGQPTVLFYGDVPQHRTLRFDADTPPVWVEREQAETAVEASALTLNLEQERLADAEARIADASARLEDALSPSPATAEFIQLAGAIRAAEAKIARVQKLAAAELTPSVEIETAGAGLTSARASFDSVVRAVRKELAGARLDAVTARVSVANAKVKSDELRSTLEALAARASDDADVRQIADNLLAFGYEGALSNQVRAWQRDAGLPVTGIVGPDNLVIASGPVHIAAHSAGVGVGEIVSASSPDGGAILDYSSIEKLVTVPLTVADQGLAAVGRTVTITLPSDAEVDGTISKVGSVVTNGAIEVTVTVADQPVLARLEVASVDVEFVSESREDVLSVPVSALLARPEGGFAVEVVSRTASDLVAVDTGLFAAGRVEVSGEGIAEGVRVGVPR